jgi:citrate synthase
LTRNENPATAIAMSAPDRIVVRGHDLVDELIGHLDFTTMICLQMRGKMPTDGERAVVDSVLVALLEHGLTPSSLAARLVYGAAPEAVQGAVAAGLLAAGSKFLGSSEDCARLLQEGAEAIRAGKLTEGTFVARIVDGYAESGDAIPGFGHHIHRPDDPRAPRLLEVAAEHGMRGIHCELLMALSATLDERKGRHITINATGAVAAVLSDAGYPWNVVRGFSLIARAAGLVGHILEESQRPIDRALWEMADHEVAYDGGMPEG